MMKKVKLSTKITGGFVVVASIIAIVGSAGLYGITVMGNAFDEAMEVQYPIADASMESMIALISGRDLMGEFLLTETPEGLERAEKEFKKTINDFDRNADYIIEHGSHGLKALVRKADEYHGVFLKSAEQLMNSQRLHIAAEHQAEKIMGDFDRQTDELGKLLAAYEEELTRDAAIDKKVDASMEAKTIMVEQAAVAEEYMGSRSIEATLSLRRKFKEKSAEFDALEQFLPPVVKEGHEQFETSAHTLFNRHDEALKLFLETKRQMAVVDEYSEKADLAMDEVEAQAGKEMDAAMVTADTASSSARTGIISITALGFGFGLLLGLFLSRSISRPLKAVIDGLSEGSRQVASASGQLSGASQSLAEGASEQAASLEETSSSMEEISSMTRGNADNARDADLLMKTTGQTVSKAETAMSQLTTSMEEISRASEETSRIIKTIDEIAFQTNLLALNAAVEAARAGEAGAGFAVVADEVRRLAMRAAQAAKETAQLIEDTVQKVAAGSDVVIDTGHAFEQVTKTTGQVGDLVAKISQASNEQYQAIEQINHAVAEMDKVVQQNAANAEESASASEEMNAQAEQLRAFVNDLVTLVDGQASHGHDLLSYGSTQSGGTEPGAYLPGSPGASSVEPEKNGRAALIAHHKKG